MDGGTWRGTMAVPTYQSNSPHRHRPGGLFCVVVRNFGYCQEERSVEIYRNSQGEFPLPLPPLLIFYETESLDNLL
jgi:hypothetical protein